MLEHDFFPAHIKMPKVVGILTFTNMKNSIICLYNPEKAEFHDILYLWAFKISCSAELSMKKIEHGALIFRSPRRASTYRTF